LSRTKKPSLTSVELTDRERMLIVLFRSCPEVCRVEVGSFLFNRWTDGPGDPQEKNARWKNACRALQVGNLDVSVFRSTDGRCAMKALVLTFNANRPKAARDTRPPDLESIVTMVMTIYRDWPKMFEICVAPAVHNVHARMISKQESGAL
jgi:hypothetical protein